ncbi:MAG: phosphotransferase [Rhizobiales bacterium]|nr:phosphotransferase [Hyphomicrobiales bacterium]
MDQQTIDESLQGALREVIPDLPTGLWHLAGEGVWGKVLDLHDGTMLKLVHRNGGIGSGDTKLIRETRALDLLNGLRTDMFVVPKLIGQERWSNGWMLGGAYMGPPLAGWLRMEKLPGHCADETMLHGAGASERDRLGESIGAAIATFHEEAAARLGEASGFGDPMLRTLKEAEPRLNGPHDKARLEALRAGWTRAGGKAVPLHGDLNLTNILKGGPRDPLGFIDLAEFGMGAAEYDLHHFEMSGPLRDAVFRGYGAITGAMPDMDLYRMGVAASAATTLAIAGGGGHPREAARRRYWLDESLYQAGID